MLTSIVYHHLLIQWLSIGWTGQRYITKYPAKSRHVRGTFPVRCQSLQFPLFVSLSLATKLNCNISVQIYTALRVQLTVTLLLCPADNMEDQRQPIVIDIEDRDPQNHNAFLKVQIIASYDALVVCNNLSVNMSILCTMHAWLPNLFLDDDF